MTSRERGEKGSTLLVCYVPPTLTLLSYTSVSCETLLQCLVRAVTEWGITPGWTEEEGLCTRRYSTPH